MWVGSRLKQNAFQSALPRPSASSKPIPNWRRCRGRRIWPEDAFSAAPQSPGGHNNNIGLPHTHITTARAKSNRHTKYKHPHTHTLRTVWSLIWHSKICCHRIWDEIAPSGDRGSKKLMSASLRCVQIRRDEWQKTDQCQRVASESDRRLTYCRKIWKTYGSICGMFISRIVPLHSGMKCVAIQLLAEQHWRAQA